MSRADLPGFTIRLNSTVSDVISCIDRSGKISIALVIDEQGRLINTLTDGDVRRAILAGVSLGAPLSELLRIKAKTPHVAPVTAKSGTPSTQLLQLMRKESVRQIPLLDESGRVVDIVVLGDLEPQKTSPMRAMIMAGGLGTRLRPLTNELPKPMLAVGERPILELLIKQLIHAGINRIDISVNYHGDKIIRHFRDGKEFGAQLNYVSEDEPLGTAGALTLIEKPKDPLLVINGDIITQVDFQIMLLYHRTHLADMTVAVRQFDLQVPYGVIECEGENIRTLKEKPQVTFLVNAGIYLLEPSIFDNIPRHKHLDMTELIQSSVDAGRSVVSFPVMEYWLDIGRRDDYEQAQNDARSGRYDSLLRTDSL